MQKIIRISIYLSILVFYNLTTLYTAVVHNHQFKWNDDESCSAYLISISQNSDTFTFSVNHTINASSEKIVNFQNSNAFIKFDINNTLSTRAPPFFI